MRSRSTKRSSRSLCREKMSGHGPLAALDSGALPVRGVPAARGLREPAPVLGLARPWPAAVRLPHGSVSPFHPGIRRRREHHRLHAARLSRRVGGVSLAASQLRLAFGLACSAFLSLALESLQLYLPTRTSSNLDLLANTMGGAAGALAALATTRSLMDAEGLQRLRNRLFLAGRRTDLGLVLLGLWLFAQLSPETLLFGTGDLRDLFKAPSGKLYPADTFLRVEAGVACANGLAAGLLALCLTARDQPARGVVVIFLAAALAVHSFGFGMVVSSQDVLAWVTPGSLSGVAVAITIMLLAAGMPRAAQL